MDQSTCLYCVSPFIKDSVKNAIMLKTLHSSCHVKTSLQQLLTPAFHMPERDRKILVYLAPASLHVS